MKQLGGTMFLFGIISAVLHFINYELVILIWIDSWGPTVGWIIRAALVIVGGVLWLIANKNEGEVEASEDT